MFGDDEAPRATAWRRYGVPASIGGFVLGGAWLIMGLLQHGGPPARPHVQPPHITSITLPPPPPPPPPPPTKEPPKPVEQPRAAAAAPKKMQAAAPKAPAPPAGVTTSIKGSGAGAIGNGNDGGGDLVGDGSGGGGDGDAYYENLVVSQVSAILREDGRLRTAHYHGRAAIRLDKSGHVTSVSFENFDGDSEIRDIVVHDLARLAFDDKIPASIRGQPLVVNLHAHAPG
jgi:hypothetical protein